MADQKLTLALIVQTVDKATKPLRQIAATTQRVTRATGLDRVSLAAARVGRNLRDVSRESMRLSSRALLVGGAAATAMGGIATKVAATGDQIAKHADLLGLKIESFQKLRFGAAIAGIDDRTFDMGMQRFTRRTAEAAAGTGEARDALKELGIALHDSDGNLRPTEELLYDVAEAFHAMQNPQDRLRLAFKLFDSEGAAMARFLAEGPAQITAWGEEAERLGILTEEQARQSEAFIDGLTRLKAAFSGVTQELSTSYMPTLTEASEKAANWIAEHRTDAVNTFRDALRQMLAWATGAAAAVGRVGKRIGEMIQEARDAIPWLDDLLVAAESTARELNWLAVALSVVALWMGRFLLRAVIALVLSLGGLVFWIARAGAMMLWLVAKPILQLVLALTVPLVSALFAVVLWLGRLGLAALVAGGRLLLMATVAVARLVKSLWLSLVPALVWAGRAMLRFAARTVIALAMMLAPFLLNPIALTILGIAALIGGIAFLLYKYGRDWYDAGVALLQDLWEGVRDRWMVFWSWFEAEWNALVGIVQGWKSAGKGLVIDLWLGVLAKWLAFRRWLERKWDELTAAIPDWIEDGKELLRSFWRGVETAYGEFWDWLWREWELLTADIPDWTEAGKALLQSLWDGFTERWQEFRDWIALKFEELLDVIPEWARPDFTGPTGPSAAPALVPFAKNAFPNEPSIFSPASGSAPDGSVNGAVEVKVEFDNAPKSMRLAPIRTEGPVAATADVGYAMGDS